MVGKEDPTFVKPFSFVLPSYMTFQKYIENRNKIMAEKEKVEEERSKLEEKKCVRYKYKRAAKRSVKIVEESCRFRKRKKEKGKFIEEVEDAKVMKRQTEVTVVLGILAAIYLPLTLVTGIFGMNINEVNEGVPDWIWVVKVWSWIFSVTIIPILIYGMVRLVIKYCRARREKMMGKDLDFEAQKLE